MQFFDDLHPTRYLKRNMSAVKVIRSFLPPSLSSWEESRLKKRRKQAHEQCGHGGCYNHNSILMTPSAVLTRSLANNGIPDRFDPLSLDHFMNFEVDEGRSCGAITPCVVRTIELGDTHALLSLLCNTHDANSIRRQRNAHGETLLHLACRMGSHAVVDRLLQQDIQLPTLVLDGQGRNPLHSVCLAMNSCGADNKSNSFSFLQTLRFLLRHTPTLLLYIDPQGKTPLEYLQVEFQAVNDLLLQEGVVERVVGDISRKTERAKSRQRMTPMETVDHMVNLSGVDAAIMESGFSI